MKTIGKIVENVIVFVAVAVVMFLVATMVAPKFGYSLIVIKSGSMEPTIATGSIVIAQKQADYGKGDIITYVNQGNKIITHRAVDVMELDSGTAYRTKGDNNNSEDTLFAQKDKVIGKTVFAVPYFGYLIGFLKTKLGILLLILIPAIYLIGRESWKIKQEWQKRKKS